MNGDGDRVRVALATAAPVGAADTDMPLLLEALAERGVAAGAAVWDDPTVDWDMPDLVVVRSTWDYSQRRDEFLAWAEHVDSSTTLLNPPRVLRWNTDKRYLVDLAQRSIPVVPTLVVGRDDPPPHPSALEDLEPTGRHGWVVKPTVAAGARDAGRHRDPDAVTGHVTQLRASGREALVQPYMAEVDDRGEVGLVWLDGVFSHAFRKAALLRDGVAVTRDVFDAGTIRPARPDEGELDLARRALSTASDLVGDALYARVDLLPGPDGTPVLSELELTEPSLFLDTDRGSPARAAAAIERRLDRT